MANTGEAAAVSALVAAAISMLGVLLQFFTTPIKYWLEKKALRYKLETEGEYEQRKKLRELVGAYRGRVLEAGEALNHRMWNLYSHDLERWLRMAGRYDNPHAYYFRSFIYRFLHVLALVRVFETRAVFIDPKLAEQKDLEFVKFMKAFSWAACDVALFDSLPYDHEYATDHFFHDELRKMCDTCVENGEFISQEKLNTILNDGTGFHSVFQFFDDLQSQEDRLRWDRLVILHLLMMAFLNTFGYDMQRSSQEQFTLVTHEVQNLAVLKNFALWLPKLGLESQAQIQLVLKAINITIAESQQPHARRATSSQ